ncbi:MAG: helix-turn-helix domain-containing protein [Candidatus Methylomirabilales bacterium]
MSEQNVQSVDRALSILTLLAKSRAPLGPTSLANQLTLPKSTVHRLLTTLDKSAFVDRSPGGQYRVGAALRALRH